MSSVTFEKIDSGVVGYYRINGISAEIHIDENGTGNASFELDEDGYYEEDFFNHDKDSQWYGHFHTFECNEDGADKAFDLLMESYLVQEACCNKKRLKQNRKNEEIIG